MKYVIRKSDGTMEKTIEDTLKEETYLVREYNGNPVVQDMYHMNDKLQLQQEVVEAQESDQYSVTAQEGKLV